ncbi:MAG: peptide chain release factor N(5)-glutamine methyltransferase [Acidimicrobiales bacterium]
MTATWRQLLDETADAIGSRSDARRLVEQASGHDGAELVVHLDDPATALTRAHLEAMAERRAKGEPLQYVVGRWGFRTLDLIVDPRVLIPRPETEQVVEWALAEAATIARRPIRAADLGTGSGAIALSLAVELRAEVWATDVSADALDVARANLTGIGMWAATRVRTVEGSWWAALPAALRGDLDLIVSNPPYVAEHDPLPPEVIDHEPVVALRAGPEGMDAIHEIVTHAGEWLAPGGVLVVELDPRQSQRTVDLARVNGAARAEVRVDALGRDRAVVAQW